MAFARARGAVRFGAVTTVVLLSGITGGLTALPAQAAGGNHIAAFVSAPEATLLPQSSGAPAQRFHQVGLVVMGEDAPVHGVTVTVDASKAASVAELSLGKGCSYTDVAKLHERCAVGDVDTMAQVSVGLRSTSGAALGAKGTVRFTVTATDAVLDPQNGPLTTAVAIGSGPDLAVGTLPATLNVKAGQPLAVSPTVQNLGDQDATAGVTLFLDTDTSAFALGGDYSNCLYGGKDVAVVCHFDTVVKPGEAYQPAIPVQITAGAHAADGDALLYGWDVKGGLMDRQVSGGRPGKGAPLTLVPVAPTAQARVQVDIDYDNNIGVSELHLVTGDDVAVVAPRRIDGTVGHTVSATFGVRNAGTAPTHVLDGTSDITAGVLVVLPKGVSVASLPKDCELIPGSTGGTGNLRGLVARGGFGPHASAVTGADEPPAVNDGTPYVCAVHQVLKPGQQAAFTFSLKLARPLAQAPGLAVAVGQANDNTPDNNIAEFYVTATKAGATATPAPTHSAAPTASPAAPGGGLAHTGGGSSAVPLAAAGAGAIVLGAGAVLLTRRRRGANRS